LPVIYIHTEINAPLVICFDLSRSIDLHIASTIKTGEYVIAGRQSGLICLHETVTWKARHFGIWQTLTSKITAFEAPNYFADEMVSGAFKSFRHEHHFQEERGRTIMKDIFEFQTPFGIFGKLAEILFLKKYMERLLTERNKVIKNCAEHNDWKQYLS